MPGGFGVFIIEHTLETWTFRYYPLRFTFFEWKSQAESEGTLQSSTGSKVIQLQCQRGGEVASKINIRSREVYDCPQNHVLLIRTYAGCEVGESFFRQMVELRSCKTYFLVTLHTPNRAYRQQRSQMLDLSCCNKPAGYNFFKKNPCLLSLTMTQLGFI